MDEVRAEPARQVTRTAVLLTSAGQRVGLVQSLRAAGQAMGLEVRVVACDRSPRNRPACLIADAAYQIGDPNEPGYVESLLEICTVHRVRLIIPTEGAELPALSRNRGRFAALGVGLAGSGPDLVAMSGDPARLKLFNAQFDGPGDLLGCAVDEGRAERRFEVLMYFNGSGTLRAVIPCERVEQEGAEHLVTRHCPALEQLAKEIAERLHEPRSVVSFDASIGSDGRVRIGQLRTHFGETAEMAHLAGAQLLRWLLREHCYGEQPPETPWREGVEMFRYEAAMFILPQQAK